MAHFYLIQLKNRSIQKPPIKGTTSMAVLDNIQLLQEFEADPDQSFVIAMSETILLMPIFRWNGTDWQEATGDYDLCLSANQKTLEFINRRPTTEKYAYRYISPFWFVNRSGKQGH
jgi:hypothetical protein